MTSCSLVATPWFLHCPCKQPASSSSYSNAEQLSLVPSLDERSLQGARAFLSNHGRFRPSAHYSRQRNSGTLAMVVCRTLRTDASQVNGGEVPSEKLHRQQSEELLSSQQQQQQQKKQLKNRIVFGLSIGLGVIVPVAAGGWLFASAMAWAVFLGTREYFELVRSKGITKETAPPPMFVEHMCSAFCAAMPLMTLYFGGRMGVSVTTAAFFLATVLLLQRGSPRFSHLSSAFFGIFYCGYLPSFWVKLRALAVPALQTKLAGYWPVLLGGPAHWTVGLLATFISFCAVIAADTGAFLGGKLLGRTPLNDVSPKKTFEGAAVGLTSAITVTVLLAKVLQWPSSILSAVLLAVLVFLSSLFGDLTESMIKRDAGVKDSGQLIPGHGGILDRADSYMFTGALVYFFVKMGLPLYGV